MADATRRPEASRPDCNEPKKPVIEIKPRKAPRREERDASSSCTYCEGHGDVMLASFGADGVPDCDRSSCPECKGTGRRRSAA